MSSSDRFRAGIVLAQQKLGVEVITISDHAFRLEMHVTLENWRSGAGGSKYSS
jgi:hypothetical protein